MQLWNDEIQDQIYQLNDHSQETRNCKSEENLLCFQLVLSVFTLLFIAAKIFKVGLRLANWTTNTYCTVNSCLRYKVFKKVLGES